MPGFAPLVPTIGGVGMVVLVGAIVIAAFLIIRRREGFGDDG